MKAVVNDSDTYRLPERPVAAHESEVPEDRVRIFAIVKIWIAVAGRKLMMVRVGLVHFVVGNEPVAE